MIAEFSKTPEMLTVRQAAQRGILPERTIRRLISDGKIPTVKAGTRRYLNATRLCEDLQRGEGAIWSDESEVHT